MDTSNAFRSKSLIYRAVEDNDEDKAFIHSLWLEPQLLHQHRYWGLCEPNSRVESDAFSESGENNRLINLVICLPGEDKPKPIGHMNLHGYMNVNSRQHRTHDIGIMIGAAHHGHGHGSDAVWWILNWDFQSAGLHRIGIESASFSTAAIRLWKSLGFKEDGRVREALWNNGG
jgi:RimJ/RimL family protein N-acetyltransferase